jgi:hypothetical protein
MDGATSVLEVLKVLTVVSTNSLFDLIYLLVQTTIFDPLISFREFEGPSSTFFYYHFWRIHSLHR